MKPYSNRQIGKSIRELRIKSGLSKRQFAKALHTSNKVLVQIERKVGWKTGG